VRYGARDPSSDKTVKIMADRPEGTVAMPVREACEWADVIIVATPGPHEDAGIQALAASFGAGAEEKVVLDTTNPLTPFKDGLEVRWGQDKSAGEVLSEALPGSFVFKAFNTIGVEHMSRGDGRLIQGEQLSMAFAGPDDEDKNGVAAEIISRVGFKPVRISPSRTLTRIRARILKPRAKTLS